MANNTFIPVVFNDGEPLDPTKLNNLMANITNVYAAQSSLNNSTVDGTPIGVPVVWLGQHKFEDLKNGDIQTIPLNFEGRFTEEELKSGKVRVNATIRTRVSKTFNPGVSVDSVSSAPTLAIIPAGGFTGTKSCYVDVIAICLRS